MFLRLFSRLYLIFISIYYFLLGIAAATAVKGDFGPDIPLFPLSVIGIIFGGVPFRFNVLDIQVLHMLGFIAIGLAIIALISLFLIKRFPGWIGFWYFLCIAAGLIFLDNVILTLQRQSNLNFTFLFQIVHPLFLYISVRTVSKGLSINPMTAKIPSV